MAIHFKLKDLTRNSNDTISKVVILDVNGTEYTLNSGVARDKISSGEYIIDGLTVDNRGLRDVRNSSVSKIKDTSSQDLRKILVEINELKRVLRETRNDSDLIPIKMS
jgi:hypothetical protein